MIDNQKVEAVIHQLDCVVCRGSHYFITASDFSNICNQHLARLEKDYTWRSSNKEGYDSYRRMIDELHRRGITRRPE